MSDRFSDQLRAKADPIWQAQLDHPFVRDLSDGTLTSARFEVWLRQDFLHLLEYARLLALAAARGPDLESMKWTLGMAHGVLDSVLLLHRSYAVELGLSDRELGAGTKLPSTRAYTDHLIRTAAVGSYLDLAAALLPRAWLGAEVGKRLEAAAPAEARYRRWIETYSGPVSQDLARRGRQLLDNLAKKADAAALASAEEVFLVSCRYEWMFWQMCYSGERWPI